MKWLGPALVGLAALLWASDTLFRLPATGKLDPAFIVFVEHAIALGALLPWILLRRGSRAWKLSSGEWSSSAFAGIGGSALATLFFTASFRFVNPSVTILLQKLQPVLVVLLAIVFLGERPQGRFFGWATLAIASGIVLSFPDFRFDFVSEGLDFRSKGVLYALSAAGIWAVSTVVGKVLTREASADLATFWRYAFGFLTLGAILLLGSASTPWDALGEPALLESLAYMALVPGLLAMLAYYSGLKRTPASVATFMELLFPVSAVAINWIYLGQKLDPVQLCAAASLLFSASRAAASAEGGA